MKAVLRNNLIVCILICVVSSLGMVNEASAGIFTDPNLVGYWQFNNNTPNDSSPLCNDGTFVGDASSDKDVLYLDGTGDYVDCANDTSLLPDAWTVSAWVKAEDKSDSILIGFGSSLPCVYLQFGSYGKPRLRMGLMNCRDWVSSAWDTLKDGNWHHVIFSIPGTDQNDIEYAKMYLDSKEVSVDSTYTISGQGTKSNFYIGATSLTNYKFKGLMDEVMFFDAVLNEYEIRQLYEQGNKAYGYFNEVTADVFRGSNCTATGTKAVALGDGTTASGEYSTAFGKDTVADGNYATAMGGETIADGNYATAMGYLSRATGDYSFAAGYDANATGNRSIAIGYNSESAGLYSFAAGNGANSVGERSIALGHHAVASNSFATALGNNLTASGIFSTAIGLAGKASGSCSTVIGYASEASNFQSIAIGYRNKATAEDSIALGKYSINDVNDSFSVGYGSGEGSEQVDFRVRSEQVDVYGDFDVTDTVTMGTLILPVKTTTGDPASPVEGQIYVNTYDNKVSVYADGAWRDLATW